MEVPDAPERTSERMAESLSLSELLRPLGSRSEAVRPFMPVLGGPRLYLLLLYAAVLIGACVEFFLSQELWYGSWEVYNTYVFVVAGFFILMGIMLLYLTTGKAFDDGVTLPLSKDFLWVLGLITIIASGAGLAGMGADSGGWSVLLSVLVVSGFVLMVMGMKSISNRDSVWLAVYGFGIVMMALMPVHEAFDVAKSPPGEYPFTGLNIFLLAVGMSSSLLSLQFMRTRDGYLGAWLMGAMVVFLLAFHEQVGILETGTYAPYDRGLALIGIVFSFVPLILYLWKEKEYLSMWTRLRKAAHLMHTGDFPAALVHADASVQASSESGVSHKFSLPWNVKGDVLYHMKEYSKAKTNYDMALEIDPDDSTTWSHLGNIYAFEGKRALALSSFDRAIQADPKNAVAWNNKGAVFSTLEWPEEAMACFNRAVALDPKNFDAYINLAKTSVKLGRSDDAVMYFQKAVELRPRSRLARDGLQREFFKGMCLDQIRGWEELGLDTTHLRSLLKEDPADFDRKSKEFLTSIVEQRTQLVVGGSQDKFDVNSAIRAILKVTADKGATLDSIMTGTGLTSEQLVLPMALLMKTERLHFKRLDMHDVYVSQGRAPEAPVIPVPPPAPEPQPRSEPAPGKVLEPRPEPESEPESEEEDERDMEPTASILVFGGRARKKKRRR